MVDQILLGFLLVLNADSHRSLADKLRSKAFCFYEERLRDLNMRDNTMHPPQRLGGGDGECRS